jgi:hypothetical protein
MEARMNGTLRLDMDALTVTTFETAEVAVSSLGPSVQTVVGCCPNGCDTRLTCSSSLC